MMNKKFAAKKVWNQNDLDRLLNMYCDIAPIKQIIARLNTSIPSVRKVINAIADGSMEYKPEDRWEREYQELSKRECQLMRVMDDNNQPWKRIAEVVQRPFHQVEEYLESNGRSEDQEDDSPAGWHPNIPYPFPEVGTPEWGEMNKRRWELIHKNNHTRGLSEDEHEERNQLQKLMREKIQDAYPTPEMFGPQLDEIEQRLEATPITEHSGKKYLRKIKSPVDGAIIEVDVYAVLKAFRVEGHPLGHAIKKLLCAGQRSKGSRQQDLSEAIDAINCQLREDTGNDN